MTANHEALAGRELDDAGEAFAPLDHDCDRPYRETAER
jgi:hypothetical protein